MSIAPLPPDRRAARIAIVEHHLRLENEHNLEGVLATFGDSARYDDEPWNEHYTGAAGVRQFYEQLMRAIPDLVIDVQRQHITDDAILVEVIIRGTHQGAWRDSRPPAATSNSLFVEFTLSIPTTASPEKKSITTVALPSVSSVFSMSHSPRSAN